MQIEKIYEDIDYLIVNKPTGVLTIPDRFDKKQPNLFDILKSSYEELYIVHRIDKDTTGVVCFAKNQQAHKELSKMFEERNIVKIYLAIVYGKLPTPEGKIELPISEDKNNPTKVKIDFKNGKISITEYKVVQTFKNYTFLEVYPLTGRRHQIRIHLSTIGHPIVADKLYSSKDAFYLSEIKKDYKNKNKESPIISRCALHAYKLKFLHFRTNKYIEIAAPLPKDFELLLKLLRKYNSVE